MSENSEFRDCLEELQKQRALLLASEPSEDPQLCELVKSVTDLAQNQLSALQTINEFFKNFTSNSTLKEQLQSTTNSIPMPGRNAAKNLIQTTKAALEIHKEVVSLKNDYEFNPELFESDKTQLKTISNSDFNNHEFNRCFRQIGGFYSGPLTPSQQPEPEELGDSTVNTIVSEDVLTSSPF